MDNLCDNCCICLEKLNTNLKFNKKKKKLNKIVKLKCNHLFHYNCISEIKNYNCPLCRDKIINQKICPNNHITYFNIGYIKKNGFCSICFCKTFKSILNDYIIN